MPIMNLDESKRYVDMIRNRLEYRGDGLSKDAEKDILCRTIWARSKAEWVMIVADVIDGRGFTHGRSRKATAGFGR